MTQLYSIDEITQMIQANTPLLLAGDEALLSQLPKGKWIGGTIPYFMAPDGGIITKEKIYAHTIPADVIQNTVKFYSKESIKNVYTDSPENGFSTIIIPASCPTHLEFAMNAPNYEKFAMAPLIGWISGINLADLGKIAPKIFNGETGEHSEEGAIVMHSELPSDKYANISIYNIFEQGEGDTIEFAQTGFSTTNAIINGTETNLAEYVLEHEINTKLPLVADYCGAMINISFQAVHKDTKTVDFYAPVFPNVTYRLAKPLVNYVAEFEKILPSETISNIGFSCNCILNFLYGQLEGKQTGNITGPITFGEIAYQLVNQTLVILAIENT